MNQSSKDIEISVVIPSYNEGENIPLVLCAFADTFKKASNIRAELIIVDNNSKDNTADILKQELAKPEYSFAKSVFEPVPGYGVAITKGLAEAKGKYLCWTHADMQTPPDDVIRAYELYEKSGGKRVIQGKRIGRPFIDWLFTFGMTILSSIVLFTKLSEINAQPKFFGRDLYNLMKNPPTDFSLDLYLLYIAHIKGYKNIKMPVYFEERLHGESKSGPDFKSKLKTSIRTVKYIFKLRKKLHSDS